MNSNNASAWTYHRSKLRTDLPIAAGLAGAVLVTTLTLAGLHDQFGMSGFIVAAAAGLGCGILLLTVVTREIFRRLNRADDASAVRSPRVVLVTTFAVGLLLVGGVCRVPLQTGLAYQQGRQHLKSQNYQAAVESFTRYVKLQPGKSMGYYWRGLALFEAGKTDAAYTDLKAAMRLAPRDRNAHILYLGTLERLGRKDELESELRAAENWNPEARQSLMTLRPVANET